MPSAAEFRAYEAQARRDTEDYRWYATLHPSRATYYEQNAENRLYHADAYAREAERLERMK